MKKLLLLSAVVASGFGALAQTYQPVTVTGYNADVIANGTGAASASTTQAVDIANFSLAASNYVNPSSQSPTVGLPSTGLINSAATPGLSFQLAPFTGNNALRIPATGTGTGTGTGLLMFSTPTVADKIYVLGLSGNGISTVTITVTFTDNSTEVFTGQTFNDWFGGSGFAIQNIGRVNRTTSVIENPAGDPRIYQKELVLSAANKIKPIQNILFNKTSATGVLNIMGVSIQAAASTLAVDAGVTGIITPVTACNLSNQETVTIAVTNFGSTTQSNIPVSYTINTGTPVTETMAGPLVANSTANYTFTTKANLSTPATYNITARTNLTGDLLATNDSFTKTVINSGATAVPTITTPGPASICPGTSVLLTANTTAVNPTYTWYINGSSIPNANAATFNASAVGNYTVKVSSGGCSATSVATSVILNPTPATPTISRSGNILTSSSATGNQWYRNGAIIAGATNQTHTLTTNGNYTVVATVNGCVSANSQTFAVTNIVGIKEAENLKFELYPNPAAGEITLKLPTADPTEITVSDLAGKVILQQKVISSAKINLINAAKGIYVLRVGSEGKTAFQKLILE